MVKKLLGLVAVLLTSTMLLTGCGSSEQKLKLATGGTSGTYYPYGGVLSQTIGSKLKDVKVDVQATGASAANIRLVSSGDVDLAIVQNDVMSYAQSGTETFAGKKTDKFATVATLYAEVCQIIVDQESEINSIADLKGKRVSVGDAGSGVEANAKQILEAYGITFADITKQNLGFGDSATALKDKKIDAFFVTAGHPTTAIMELASTNKIKLLPIEKDKAEALKSKYKFYTDYKVPKGTYNGVNNDTDTLAVKATLICKPNLSPDLVYDITKTIFENKSSIAAANAKGAELDNKKAVEGISVPLHPGAEKYFKQIGVLK